MDPKTIPAQSLGEDLQHPPRIVLTGEHHHEVVRVADQGRFAPKPRLDDRGESLVEHDVQVAFPAIGCRLRMAQASDRPEVRPLPITRDGLSN
jgi:hypothetical protein